MTGNVATADYRAGGKSGSINAMTGDHPDDPELVARPSAPVFTVTPTPDVPDPGGHAEYKALEAFAERFPRRTVKGEITIYSEHYPCASCREVVHQFLRLYPRMRAELGYTFDRHGRRRPRPDSEEFALDPVNTRLTVTHLPLDD